MGHVHHVVDKTIIHGHVKDFQEAKKENRLFLLTIGFVILIVLYFVYVLSKVAVLLRPEQGNFLNQFLLLLPHLILLSIFGVPIIRKVLLWIKFTPFYLRRDQVRAMRSKTYNKIRIKRFIAYFAISFVVFLIALFYMFIL